MKVIDQYHEILHITPDVLALVEKAGRQGQGSWQLVRTS
jgi:hypothetical protein